jgi:hypothetical protein
LAFGKQLFLVQPILAQTTLRNAAQRTESTCFWHHSQAIFVRILSLVESSVHVCLFLRRRNVDPDFRFENRWLVGDHLADSRTARNRQFRLADPLR